MKRLLVIFVVALTALSFGQGQPGPSRGGPYSGGGTKVTAKQLSQLEKTYNVSKKAYEVKGAKSDAKTKKAFTDAGYAYGYACMTSDVLDRKVKYKKALALYREVLKVDPGHKQAKSQSDLIISIYKQMGLPVPN